MAKPHHILLAQSLEQAKKSAYHGIVRVLDISRSDRERLENNGWLTRIIRGWYMLKQPSTRSGDSTQWYSSFWDFVNVYLASRFKKNYCLSANASIDLFVGKTIIPQQLLVMVKTGSSSIIQLPFKTSIVIYRESKTFPKALHQINNINVMPLPLALQRIAPTFFQQQPHDAQIALKLVDPTALSRELLNGSNIAAAERIIGAYSFLNENQQATRLQADLTAAGYKIDPVNPFTIKEPLLTNKLHNHSPYAARIAIMWQSLREMVLSIFPNEPGKAKISNKYFAQLEKIYVNDAYNSLSIEGYEVSEELIAKIASGQWDPESSSDDKNQINAMAAKGYRQAFDTVKLSIKKIFQNENPGKVIKNSIHGWYSALFSPSVKAGLLKPEHLAGYRTHQVYIRGSMHTPLPPHALMDAMEIFFDCLINEPHAAVRAILGHFIFVFIHPFMDGNGRIARFMMNSLFASGGFPWTVITVAHREQYLKSLELASVKQDIKPFAKFVLSEMKH